MVASAFPDATAAGVEMLAQGGNAIDAACAVGFALGVCEPQASGLGGQSTGLVHFEGRTFAVDGSSRAPSLAHKTRLEKARRRRLGYRATTVPSTPAACGWLHRHYGRLDWATVLEPAVRLARQGYRITQLQHDLQVRECDNFEAIPSGSGARYFLSDGGKPHPVGSCFRQPDLAGVLELMASNGVEAFYQGDIAQQIDADMVANDGLLRADDLALIPWPIERPPVSRRYRGYLVKTMPPPGAGRTLLLVLLMLNYLQSKFVGGQEPPRYHFLAETFRKAFMQRQDRPFDPNTYPQIQHKRMLSKSFAREQASSIAKGMDVHLPLEDAPGEDVGETTHFSVMDKDGNTVAMTQSIELAYGSKAAADGLGFLYNNYMMAFELDNPAHPYYLRPNAVPWSTAAPTIVFRRKQPWLAAGSPGSERIFSALAQFFVNVVDGSAPISEAAAAPRIHCSTGGRLSYEERRAPADVVAYLEQLGYRLTPREPYAFYLGCVQAVLKRQTDEGFQGVADPRRDGTAAGPQ
ncbi:MAG: gamma-glutamyltransferase [Gemmatimonadota bacterium]|nr:MAG: gamma-glutamyltransferase [Gemmatimonadota bacterium]